MDYLQWILVSTLLTNAVQVWCFLPSRTTSTLLDTYTHTQITQDGVKKAAANFLNDNGLVEGSYLDADRVLDNYFGSDTDSQEKFNNRIQDLSTRMSTVQRDVQNIAKYTVNGERIEDAFNLLNELSAQTRSMISVVPFDTGAQDSTFDNLAKALLVIQSFYSNTNWAEINGDVYCEAFGGTGTLPAIAGHREETCTDCDPSARFDCYGNIVVNTLTSGFRPGQDARIPNLNKGLKCAHDWNTDRNRLAIGGIGKDTTDPLISPHADIHPEAASAAIQATTAYLYQNGSGAGSGALSSLSILSSLSVDDFKSLLVLNSREKESRGSMTLVMDVSGSMGDDIMAAIKICINLVTAVQGTPNEPADYVLVTFNDPASLTTGEVFTNGNDIIARLQKLVANGGQDCPEYSMSGVRKGIELSKPGSTLYMFTDADAKDADSVAEVITAAGAKKIKTEFLITGSCRRRTGIKRRDTGRVARAIDDVYTQLAAATDGHIYQINKSELGAILSSIIGEKMPSSDVLMQTFQMSPDDSDRRVAVVDPTMNLFKIEVSSAASVDDVAVEDPNGSTLQYLAGVASRYYSDGNVIISVQKPLAGNWTIIRTATKLLAVNVTGSSSFDFTFQLTEQDETGVSYIISGNPIAGYNYTISTQVFNLDHNASLKSISLVNLFGNEVERIKTSLHRIGSEMFAVVDFTMPSESVRVQLTGVLPGGESFQRTNLQVVSPVSVTLRLRTILDPFPFNEPQNITYLLGNQGPVNQTLLVDIDTDLGRLPRVTYAMYAGEVNEYKFQVTGQPTFQTMMYTVSVRETGTEVILQSLSGTVWFESPACDIIYNEGACPETVDPPASCQSITWFSHAVFSPEVTSHNISTRDANIEIMAGNRTDDGRQYIDVRGDCCAPSVYLSTLGPGGYMIGQCHYNFGSVPTVTVVVEPPPSEFTTDWTLVGWIVGVTCVCLIILVAVASWQYRRRIHKSTLMEDTE